MDPHLLWTLDEKAWLRENYPHYHNQELSDMHAAAFPDRPRRTAKAINARARYWGLKKADDFVRIPRTLWTEERLAWFASFVPGHEEREISAEHERIFGTPLTRTQIKNAKANFGIKSGTKGGCFEKGHEPHNKGKTWDEIGISEEKRARIRTTQFKKGLVPHNAVDKPVGYERINRDGYVEVKVAERPSRQDCNDNFRFKHHIVYEQHNGEIPEDCNIVFADHDRMNFNPDNLVAVPRSLWATIRHIGYPYSDAQSLETAMNVARLVQAKNQAKRRLKESRKKAK